MVKVFSKSLSILMVAASSFWSQAADAQDPVVARYHFVGTAQLTGPNFDSARKFLNQPASVEYRDLVLNRFAGKIAATVFPAKGKNNGSAIRPLLDDLVVNESVGVFGAPAGGSEPFVIAVHLNKERAAAWVQSVEKLADPSGRVRVQQEGEWLLVSSGDVLKAAETQFLGEIRSKHRPVPALKNDVLDAKIDWPRLSNVPALASLPFKPAVLQLKVTPKANHLRTEIHAHYPQPIAWKSQPWQLPTETIRDPLISFTAGQNAAAFMKQSKLAELIGANPFTNEFFIFANLSVPFETTALFPMKNPQRYLQSIGRELPAKVNSELKQDFRGELRWFEKTNLLVWQGMPILAPFARPLHEKAGDFLCVGTFAVVEGPPAPADLWSQFKGRTDLVYYDWEIAGPRLTQWRMLTPLLPIFPMKRVGEDELAFRGKTNVVSHTPNAIVDRWITALTVAFTPSKEKPGVGNVITEVTRKSASDYTVVRSSELGFTGIELLLLSHWLADTHPSEVGRLDMSVPGMQKGAKPAARHAK